MISLRWSKSKNNLQIYYDFSREFVEEMFGIGYQITKITFDKLHTYIMNKML